jgi:hypothetical protein
MVTRVADLVEKILDRERVYIAALEADITLLTKQHGAKAIEEAFALIGTRDADTRDHWDRQGHALAVARGISSLLRRRVFDGDGPEV